jgi:hypothetical protein
VDTCGDANGGAAGDAPFQCPAGQRLKAGVDDVVIKGVSDANRPTSCCEEVRNKGGARRVLYILPAQAV